MIRTRKGSSSCFVRDAMPAGPVGEREAKIFAGGAHRRRLTDTLGKVSFELLPVRCAIGDGFWLWLYDAG